MKLRALLILAAVLPGAAYSQPYFSANIGWASGDYPLGAPFNGFVDDAAPTYGLDVGIGLRDWAVEFGVSGYGNFDGSAAPCAAGTICTLVVTEESVDQNIFDAALVRRFTLRKFELFGKAGYYRAKIDTDVPFPDADFKERGLMLGVGARWYFEAPWAVSIEGTRYDDNVSQVTIGFGWGLGFTDRDRDGVDDRGFGRDRDRDRNDDDDRARRR